MNVRTVLHDPYYHVTLDVQRDALNVRYRGDNGEWSRAPGADGYDTKGEIVHRLARRIAALEDEVATLESEIARMESEE